MNSRWIVVCVFVVLIVTAIGIVPGKTVNAELDLTGSPGGLNSLAINPDFSTSSETLPTSNYVEADNVELIGHIGGATPAIAVQGSYAYVGEGPRLTILDISDPASPIVAGKTGALFKLALDVTVAGNYAYIADNGDFSGGIRIIDVSHPATPTEASYFEIMGHAYAVDVSGDYAYVAANDAGLAIVDVSNPEAPFEIGYYDLEDLALDVAVAGHYAYIVTYYDGLRIINISDPTAPTEVAFEPYGRASGVAVAGNYVYVADDRGLTIVDISDPDTPIAVQSHYVSNAERVAVAGNYAYVLGSNFHDVTGDFFYGIQVINIADPTVPVEAGYYETSGEPLGVAVAGDHAYVTDESGGLRIVSVTDPNMPTEVGRYEVSGYAYDVAIVGSHAYVTSRTGLHVINIANPAVPTEAGVGFFESFENPGGLMSLAVSGDYAYVTDYFAGLRIINLSNPITPIESGFFETTSPARDVVVSGDYAYIANDQDGLRVIDISNPTAPIEIGFFDTPGTAIGVAVSGDYAYVADDQAGLRIINISDPTTPIETGFIDTPKYAMDVAIAGNFAYVSDGLSLRIVNIANPAAPVEVGFYGGSLYTYFGISVIGDFAFVANTWMGLYVFNISNPEFPTLDGYYDTSGWASHVEVSGGYAYVADQKGGLAILRFTESQPHYSVSGQIVNQSGMPVSGVTVTISGSPSATTNAQGRYTINGVTTGTLTITPSKAGVVFSPVSRTVSVTSNTTGIDFRATSGGAVDLSAYALEVTQGIQDLDNSVPLVAGKRTFVRFYVVSNGGYYSTNASLVVRKGAQEVTLKPNRVIADPVGPLPSLNRGLLTQGFLFELPGDFRSGAISLTATVNPGPTRDPIETGYANNSISQTNLSFEYVEPLNLVVYSVGYEKDGTTYYPESFEPLQMVNWLQSAYPVASVRADYRRILYTKGGDPAFPDDGIITMLRQQWLKDLLRGQLASLDSRYYGMVHDGGMSPGNYVRGATPLGDIASFGITGEPRFELFRDLSWDTDGSYGDAYAGHELGHAYGLNHVDCNLALQMGTEPAQPPFDQGYPGGRISPTTAFNSRFAMYGFRVMNGNSFQVLSPDWHDMMTYCSRWWISGLTYNRLLDNFQSGNASPNQPDVQQASLADQYLVSGRINPANNEAELEPVFLMPYLDGLGERVPGAYAIVLYDTTNNELARYPFTPTPLINGPGGVGAQNLVFSELIPMASGTRTISLEGSTGVLAVVTAGLAAPSVQVIEPNGGENYDTESVTVSWISSDVDGDSLFFDVGYSSDNGVTWRTVATNLQGNSVSLMTDTLAASNEARFRIWVTDGVNTQYDDSDGPFTVANHAPSLGIIAPENHQIVVSGQTLVLQGTALDPDDGLLSGASVEWYSDLDGLLGTGDTLVVPTPSAGSHTITARATDSHGISVEQSVALTVVATEGEVPLPPDSLLISPESFSLDAATDPLSQSVGVSNENSGHFVAWSASTNQPWIILEASSGVTPGNLVYSLEVEGLEPGVHNGQITITSPDLPGTEHVVDITMTVPAVYSISGNVSEDIGFPLEGALVTDSSGAETYTDENGDYVLTGLQAGVHEVEVFYNDYEFANNPATVTLPPDAVDVDFVGTFVGLNVLLIEPMADAYVDEASKTANFGTKPYLRVKNATTDNNTYLKFEVSGLSCAAIESVGLSLFTKDPGPDGGSVYSTGINWTETGITWNNAPAISGTALGNFGAVVDESWEHVSLANAVTGDGIYSFAVRSNSSNLVEYSSGEGAYPGWLQIEYRPLPAVVPAADFLADHTSGFSPLTVNFQDTASGCPTSWLWDFGDGTTSTAQHPSHVYASPGTYEVSLTVSNGKGSDTETKTGYITVEAPPPEPDYYISPSGSATIGGFPSTPADILRYTKSTNTWTMVYDGSVRGTAKNVSAFDILDDGSLLLVFGANQVIAGLGTATAYDVVRFTPNTPGVYPLGTGTYSWFFQGRTPGLTTTTEKIDALDFDAAGNRLLLSTAGTANVILPGGTALKPADEDVFVFNRSTNQWESPLVIDGSNMTGMAVEDITSIWDDPASGDYYITITGSFNLGGVKGNSKSIVKLTPNGGATVFTPSLVPWLAPGATFPSNLDGLALRN